MTQMLMYPPNGKEVVSDFKCLCVLMWLNLSECSIAFWIYSIWEELDKQLAAFCAFHFNLEKGHSRSAIKNSFGCDELM